MTAGVEGVGMEMGQEGVRGWFELGSGGINGFRPGTSETIAGEPKPPVPLAHR